MVISKKAGFLWGQEGVTFLALQNDIRYHYLLIFYLRLKKATFSKTGSEKHYFLTLGGPVLRKLVPSFQPYIPIIEKSLSFVPPKITLKMICGRFPLGGIGYPPATNRVNFEASLFGWS